MKIASLSALLEALPQGIWFERDSGTGIAEVRLIDQTRLPMQGDVLCCRTLEAVEIAIKTLAVRAAPALGVAAALALAVWTVNESSQSSVEKYLAGLAAAAERIGSARPTAVDLRRNAEAVARYAHGCVHGHAYDHGEGTAAGSGTDTDADTERGISLSELKDAVVEYALTFDAQCKASCAAISKLGSDVLEPGSRLLTICNTGTLATTGIGTALGVVYTAYAEEKMEHVWVCETRPLNQGSRLTTWEFSTVGIPYTLITDSAAASVMAHGWVDAVLVGADRVCRNGDTANKIGTLSLATLAQHFNIPFYVCAPFSTIDPLTAGGAEVVIEQRDPREVAGFTATGIILPQNANQVAALDLLTQDEVCELSIRNGQQLNIERKGGAYAFDTWCATTVPGVQVYNPAFDVTPATMITAIITERGVFRAPYDFA